MPVLCMILDQTVCDQVKGGSELGYLNNARLNPIQRLGGTNGNPDPCYILNVAVLTNANFAAAQPYLSGCPQLWNTDPNFPPELPPPEEEE